MPDNRRKDRFHTTGEIRFSKNRDLVVSVLGDRVTLGQRITFEDDAGEQGRAYLKNMPSLDAQNTRDLIAALEKAVAVLDGRKAHGLTVTKGGDQE